MGEADFDVCRHRYCMSGKRTFAAAGKLRLIAACRQPDVSVLRMVLKASFNANQFSCEQAAGGGVATISHSQGLTTISPDSCRRGIRTSDRQFPRY